MRASLRLKTKDREGKICAPSCASPELGTSREKELCPNFVSVLVILNLSENSLSAKSKTLRGFLVYLSLVCLTVIKTNRIYALLTSFIAYYIMNVAPVIIYCLLFIIYHLIFIIYKLLQSRVGSWHSTTICIDSDTHPMGPHCRTTNSCPGLFPLQFLQISQ